MDNRNKLKDIIKEIIQEIMVQPQGIDPVVDTATTSTNPQQDAIDKQKDVVKTRQELDQQKKELSKSIDVKKDELTYKEKEVEKMKRIDIPNMTKQLQDLGKQIASLKETNKNDWTPAVFEKDVGNFIVTINGKMIKGTKPYESKEKAQEIIDLLKKNNINAKIMVISPPDDWN